jgi:hypothetical protein
MIGRRGIAAGEAEAPAKQQRKQQGQQATAHGNHPRGGVQLGPTRRGISWPRAPLPAKGRCVTTLCVPMGCLIEPPPAPVVCPARAAGQAMVAQAGSPARRAEYRVAAAAAHRHRQRRARPSARQRRPDLSRHGARRAGQQDRVTMAAWGPPMVRSGSPPAARQRRPTQAPTAAIRRAAIAWSKHAPRRLTAGSRLDARQQCRNEDQARRQRARQADQQQSAHAGGPRMPRERQ